MCRNITAMQENIDKKQYIKQLFSSIANTYDILNTILSLNLDRRWRKKAVAKSNFPNGSYILDLCTGTGEMALSLAQTTNCRIIGVDFCHLMLQQAKIKIQKANLSQRILLALSDVDNLPFKNNTFDGIIIAFSLRNLKSIEHTLKEAKRVTKSGGKITFLELTPPPDRYILWNKLYFWYLKYILPYIGGLLSRSLSSYHYLSSSIISFLKIEELLNLMKKADLDNIQGYQLTGGIATIGIGVKKGEQ